MNRNVLRWCALMPSVIALAAPLRAADNKAAFSMSVGEFRQLSEAERKALVASAFEHRLQQAANIHYEALMLISINEYHQGKVGKVIERVNGSRLRHWRLGDSFRMDTDRGGVDVSEPQQFVVCGLDADSGVVKSTVHFSDRERSFGRIGVEIDRINESNRYDYWLDGKRNLEGDDYLFRYIMEHRDEHTIQVPAGGKKIHLTVPWHPYGSKLPWGTWAFSLDPEKGFLPDHGKGSWDKPAANGKPFWRIEEFFVEASQLVGDVWMPTQLKEVIAASTGGGDKCNVFDTNISNIEAGTVTPKDLEVPFPPGMEIVDAIKGEAYVVGSGGERTRVEALVGAATSAPAAAMDHRKETGGRWRILILANVGAVVLLTALLLWRFAKRGKRRVPS